MNFANKSAVKKLATEDWILICKLKCIVSRRKLQQWSINNSLVTVYVLYTYSLNIRDEEAARVYV